MWSKARRQIAVEMEQLDCLLSDYDLLLDKCRCLDEEPDTFDRAAFAAMLHSFYTGIENIFKRVAVEIDGTLPHGECWHRELLNAMIQANSLRCAVITSSLRDNLREYLDFRHFFRNAYSFQLQWVKIEPLVSECRAILTQLNEELITFFQTAGIE